MLNTKTFKNNTRPGLNEKIAAFICSILILIVILITATQAVCYWIPGWWYKEYEMYNTPQYVTGEMSLDDAVYITEQMLEYCIGRIDTLDDTEAVIDGVSAPFFTEREKLHLADCRNIFLAAVRFRVIAIIVTIGVLLAIWFSVRKRIESSGQTYETDDPAGVSGADTSGSYKDPALTSRIRTEYSLILSRSYLAALIAFFIFAGFLVVVGMNNFTFLFTKFHHVFFDNDLWILDPRHDNLVNVMQESVFSDAAITIGSIWAIVSIVLAIISVCVLVRNRRA